MNKKILTKREEEVFSLLVKNKTTKEIGTIWNISEKTMKLFSVKVISVRSRENTLACYITGAIRLINIVLPVTEVCELILYFR